MAEDFNKKIKIEVELESEKATESVGALNKALDGLIIKQKQLTDSGLQSEKSLQSEASGVKAAQAAVENHSKVLENNSKVRKASSNTLQENRDLMASLLKQYDALTNTESDHSANVKALNTQIGALSNVIAGQAEKLAKSREVFDAHKATVNALGSGFDKLKGVSGMFGPSLQEAAEGFNALKSGLDIVKTGFNSVGDAIKTTGFGLLVLVLQSVIDYFTKTTEGSKILKGAISAIGKVVEIIHDTFAGLGKTIIDAVSHPIESIQALGKMIWDNIINRFKAFSVILDGIIHLDFKKVGDGIIQSITGVTHATDKIALAYHAVVKGATETAGKMASAFKDGYNQAGKEIDKHEKKINESVNKQIGYYKNLKKNIESTEDTGGKPNRDTEIITGTSKREVSISSAKDSVEEQKIAPVQLATVQQTEDKIVDIKKTSLQKVEDFARESGAKVAGDALTMLQDSIKRQSEAKIAGLEKDKANELSNSNLTSAQKLAIENKYKKQEAAIKVKAFKDEQKASIAQALINGAIAVTKAEAQTGVLGALVIPGIIAETAIQVAKITSQKPPAYARGGLHYQSDGRGGLLPGYSRTDNTNAHLRSGEGIVVSEAMQVPWARNLVSAINVGFGGRDFSISNPGRGYAVGGIFTDGGNANRYYNQPVNDQKNLANTIAYQMINNFPPVYVDVKDVNNQQNILAQTINRVNL